MSAQIPEPFQVWHENRAPLKEEWYVPYSVVWDRLVSERDGYKSVVFEPAHMANFDGHEYFSESAIIFHFSRPWFHRGSSDHGFLSNRFVVGWTTVGWISRDAVDAEIEKIDSIVRQYLEPSHVLP